MTAFHVGERPEARPGRRQSSRLDCDPRVVAALEEYLDALRAARPLSRAEFLARHAEIADVLDECLSGLEFVQSATESLDRTEAPDTVDHDEGLPPATRLGDFEIIREVGRGGMGVVYEAEQISLGRRVALKVLPFAAALDPRQCQRFQIEAMAAAHLQHEHIVPVFAVGSDQGVQYYAMQFIEGRALSAVIRELRARGGDGETAPSPPPRNAEDYRDIARLGTQAAEALQHAHSLGVLHRDIKPANLLLDGRDNLWITDFGLARFQDNDSLTATGNLLGTLRYMSPEQAQGNGGVVDHRADLYSLGATLYELLTLRPAFDGLDSQDLLRRIMLDEPPGPRRFDRGIPRDLETIVFKAMAKEPECRYSSARALADDLTRFLNDEPIQARRPSLIARAAKWSRRHRPAVATAGAVLTFALIVVAALQWRTATALEESLQARENERQTLLSIFKLSDTLTLAGVERFGEMMYQRGADEHFYRKALRFYEEIARQGHLDPRVRAMAYHRLGLTRMVLEQSDADAAYRAAIRMFEGLLAPDAALGPDQRDEVRLDLAGVLLDQGFLMQKTGTIDDALSLYRRGLKLESDVVATHRDSLTYNYNLRLATDLYRALSTLTRAGRRDEAEELLHECLRTVPNSPFLNNNLAWYLITLSPTLDPARAVSLARAAVAANRGSGEFWNTLGAAEYYVGNWAAAREALDESMRLRKGGDPYDWFFLAMVRAREGDASEARTWYDRAVADVRSRALTDPYLGHLQNEAAAQLGLPIEPGVPATTQATVSPGPEAPARPTGRSDSATAPDGLITPFQGALRFDPIGQDPS